MRAWATQIVVLVFSFGSVHNNSVLGPVGFLIEGKSQVGRLSGFTLKHWKAKVALPLIYAFRVWVWGSFLEGQADLVSRLITPITHIVFLLIPIINLLTKSP